MAFKFRSIWGIRKEIIPLSPSACEYIRMRAGVGVRLDPGRFDRPEAAAVPVVKPQVPGITLSEPQRVRSFKPANEPGLVPTIQDIVDLYVAPLEPALVLSVDEKCRIQAPGCSQPGLPPRPGYCGTASRDYEHTGTKTLFAALKGKLVGRRMTRCRCQEVICSLNRITRQIPAGSDLIVAPPGRDRSLDRQARPNPKALRLDHRPRRFHPTSVALEEGFGVDPLPGFLREGS
jgi:hypothetical protein